MKRRICFIIIILIVSSFIVVRKLSQGVILSNEEALRISVDKYLKFLWIVDGVFYEDDLFSYVVNGKELNKENVDFKCEFDKKNHCVINGFSDYFMNLFTKGINYHSVYDDEFYLLIHEMNDNKFLFKNISKCNKARMGKNHKLELKSVTANKIICRVYFDDEYNEDGVKRSYEKEFVLVLENGLWKISKAYYHNACHMEFNIK